MNPDFWRALDRLGANGSAVCDWRILLGEAFDACRPLLRKCSGHAWTVIDPARPHRRLDVEPDETSGFIAFVADDCPDGPPLPLPSSDVELLAPDWRAITDALGRALGFTFNRYETQGFTRQIGTAQRGRDPVRPVLLCLPAGHFGDHGRIANDLAARRDATVLLPTTRWLTPPVQALAAANRLTLITVADTLAEIAAVAAVPSLAAPAAAAAKKQRKKALFRLQPGWRWNMLTIEVATGGRVIASCDGQRMEHRFRKSNSRTHSIDYEILMRLATQSGWCNPPTGSPENEAVRRQFYRFRETLNELIGIPGDAFNTEGENWKPNFKVSLHRDLDDLRNEIANAQTAALHQDRKR